MFTPLPLRLWCMATMAPALTEAATQARAKLSNREGTTTEGHLVNGRAITPSFLEQPAGLKLGQEEGEQVLRTAHIVSFPKELLTAGIIETKQGVLPGSQQINLGALKGRSGGLRKPSVVELHKNNSTNNILESRGIMSFPNTHEGPPVNRKESMPQSTTIQPTTLNGIGPTPHAVSKMPPQRVTTPTSHTVSINRTSAYSSLKIVKDVKKISSQCTSTISSAIPSTSGVTLEDKMLPSGPDVTMTTKLDISKRQRDMERKAERLLRRLRRLQSRQAVSHIRSQLSGFVDHQHKNLQTMAKSMKSPSPSASVDLKTELLQSEDVKSLSTAALVNLVRKLQSSQALSLRQRLAHQQAANEGGSSVLRLDEDLCMEMSRVAGTLQMNLHHLESAVDSDATESSSGGESCEDDFEFDYDKSSRSSLQRRAEWKWTTNRAGVAARWTWLQAQVSDLEYRIRQQSDIYRQIRTTKGAVTLGEVPSPEDLMAKYRQSRAGRKLSPLEEKIATLERKNEMSPCNLSMLLSNVDKQTSRLTQQLGNVYSPAASPLVSNRTHPGHVTPTTCPIPSKISNTPNGFVDPNNSQGATTPDDSDIEGESLSKRPRTDLNQVGLAFDQPPSPALDNTCQAARCRPVKSYGKRKLLRTRGVHQLGRKASRLSNVKCHCYPPVTACAMCGSRYNNVQTMDTETMPLAERVSLLDSSYHPVLSFSHDVGLPIHFEALLKTGDWKHKPPPKSLKPLPQKRRKVSSSGNVNERVKKYNKRLSKSASAAMLSSAKIRSKYVEKQTRSTSAATTPKMSRAEKRRNARMKKRKAALHAINELSKRDRHLDSDFEDEEDDRLAQSLPGSTYRDMKAELMKRRRSGSAYDINNIVIPYSMAASTRVEKLQYKEIITPKWRELKEEQTSEVGLAHQTSVNTSQTTELSKAIMPEVDTPPHEVPATTTSSGDTKASTTSGPTAGDNGIIVPNNADEPLEQDQTEDISDVSFAERHMRCEILKKKKVPTATLR